MQQLCDDVYDDLAAAPIKLNHSKRVPHVQPGLQHHMGALPLQDDHEEEEEEGYDLESPCRQALP